MSGNPSELASLRRRFRAAMPIATNWAYFDHAAVGPLPEPTRVAIRQWLEEATEQGDTQWPRWSAGIEQTRQLAAGLINAQPEEIALVTNTTTGIGFVAEGFPWQAGDNVVTLENEFPSNIYPWMHLARRGVELRLVPVLGGRPDLSAIDNACDARTRIVSLSWVGYASGWRWDVAQAVELAHRHNALLMLDAIQGLGVHAIDVTATGVDFLAADGHKWLLGPEGAGILYVRQPHLERLVPQGIGWNSMVHRYDFQRLAWQPRSDAARFEGGSYNMCGLLGLGASLQCLADLGVAPDQSPVAAAVLDFRQQVESLLVRRRATILNPNEDADHQSGILCFSWPGIAPDVVRQRLREAGVVVSCRGGGLRISAHGYHDATDLDRLDAGLQTLNGGGVRS